VDSVVVMIDQLSDEKMNLQKLEAEFETEKKEQSTCESSSSEVNPQILLSQQVCIVKFYFIASYSVLWFYLTC
jgi:hypothetical protein